jgi:two-component system, sensor histidine kinase
MALPAARSDLLLDTFAARRAQLPLRVVIALSLVLVFGQIAGWAFSAGWLAVYLGLQGLEVFLQGKGRVTRPLALGLMIVNSLVFGGFALVGPVVQGGWGAANGTCLLAGGLLNAALNSQKSRPLFFAAVGPYAFYLLAVMPGLGLLFGSGPLNAFCAVMAGLMVVVISISIWRTAARALDAEADARARAEAADAAKSAFVAMVSHELRTPISAILAGAAKSDGSPRDSATPGDLGLIRDSALMMRTLLNDLLDLAKLEAGRMGVEEMAFDLRRLVLDTTRFWRPEARRRGLRFRIEGARSLPRWVSGDPTRIKQVLNNLFSNALKFTETGGVTLRLTAAEADGAWRLGLAVADTGPGMTAEQTARLFTAFEQLGDATSRTHGGTGLGLKISRELARLMGGDLTVESQAGVGSTFHLSIPAAPAEAPVESEAPSSAAAFDGQKLRALIVDDHDVNRRAFSLMLEGAFEVAVAVDGAEALEMLEREPFDVVLLDINMPGLDGHETARRLRATEGPNRHVAVIALSGSVAADETGRCLASGMNAFVMKPVQASELFAALAAVLEGESEDVAEAAA